MDTMDFKVDSAVFARSDDQLDLGSVFAQPMLGVSMNEFIDMLTLFADSWLGHDDHSSLIQDLIKFADGDKDNRVTA